MNVWQMSLEGNISFITLSILYVDLQKIIIILTFARKAFYYISYLLTATSPFVLLFDTSLHLHSESPLCP